MFVCVVCSWCAPCAVGVGRLLSACSRRIAQRQRFRSDPMTPREAGANQRIELHVLTHVVCCCVSVHCLIYFFRVRVGCAVVRPQLPILRSVWPHATTAICCCSTCGSAGCVATSGCSGGAVAGPPKLPRGARRICTVTWASPSPPVAGARRRERRSWPNSFVCGAFAADTGARGCNS